MKWELCVRVQILILFLIYKNCHRSFNDSRNETLEENTYTCIHVCFIFLRVVIWFQFLIYMNSFHKLLAQKLENY